MRLRQAQFGEPILRRVAFGPGFVLLQHEQVIRLRPGHEAIGLELAHDRCDRAAAGNAPAIQRRARQLERLAFEARQPVPALQRLDLLCADRIGKLDDDFIGHEPALVRRRRAACAAAVRLRAARPWRAVINNVWTRGIALRQPHDDAGHDAAPAGPAMPAAGITTAASRPSGTVGGLLTPTLGEGPRPPIFCAKTPSEAMVNAAARQSRAVRCARIRRPPMTSRVTRSWR